MDQNCDPQVLVDIMRVGIREFLPLPVEAGRLVEAVEENRRSAGS